MTHTRKPRPQGLTKYTGFQAEVLACFNALEDRLISVESMIAGSQLFAQAVATSEYRRDLKQMADYSKLNSTVSKIHDVAQSIKASTDGYKAERDAALAEVERLKAADAVDQAAVDAAEAKVAEITAVLEAITAVAANTPAETGGSMGGVTE